jgi:hypothetical protein
VNNPEVRLAAIIRRLNDVLRVEVDNSGICRDAAPALSTSAVIGEPRPATTRCAGGSLHSSTTPF